MLEGAGDERDPDRASPDRERRLDGVLVERGAERGDGGDAERHVGDQIAGDADEGAAVGDELVPHDIVVLTCGGEEQPDRGGDGVEEAEGGGDAHGEHVESVGEDVLRRRGVFNSSILQPFSHQGSLRAAARAEAVRGGGGGKGEAALRGWAGVCREGSVWEVSWRCLSRASPRLRPMLWTTRWKPSLASSTERKKSGGADPNVACTKQIGA